MYLYRWLPPEELAAADPGDPPFTQHQLEVRLPLLPGHIGLNCLPSWLPLSGNGVLGSPAGSGLGSPLGGRQPGAEQELPGGSCSVSPGWQASTAGRTVYRSRCPAHQPAGRWNRSACSIRRAPKRLAARRLGGRASS